MCSTDGSIDTAYSNKPRGSEDAFPPASVAPECLHARSEFDGYRVIYRQAALLAGVKEFAEKYKANQSSSQSQKNRCSRLTGLIVKDTLI